MLSRWQVLRSAPGSAELPDQVADLWDGAIDLEVPAAVATIAPGIDPDEFDWWQRCRFSLERPIRIEFSGLTFPATVFVDGAPVARCESMFVPVVIECEPGEHELVILFGSLNRWLRTRRARGRWRSTLVGSPGLRWARTTLIGRAPVYGDLPAPVGIWRPITVTPVSRHTGLTVRADAATGTVTLTGTTNGREVRAVLHGPDGEFVAERTVAAQARSFAVTFVVDQPKLWWPNGYGAPDQYRSVVEVDGTTVDDRRFGFRALNVTDDASGFRITVNGTEVFCRGATWSPPDPVRMYAGTEQIRDQVRSLAAAGANMIRVVGGLVYEQREFWQACADAGLLVWQDAMLATFDPPAEQGELLVRELTAVLRSVSGSPALAVVSGGSETLQQPEMLGLTARESAMEVLDSLFPTAVSAHSDAHYVRASPAPPPGSTDLAIRPDTGVAHWFGVGGYLRPINDVRSAGVKFAAECLAFANPPNFAFIERHFGSSAVAGHHRDWKAALPRDRGSSWDFEDVRDFYVHHVFGVDVLAERRTDPVRYLQLGRLAIATAMHDCFSFWRRRDSGCGGALVLSGRDMCAGAGWGLLDVEGNAKAALTVLARTWAPIAVTVADEGLAGVRIDVYNDSALPRVGELTMTATNSVGPVIAATRTVTVEPASSVTYTDAELSGCFRDLSHAFRFGPPTADAVQATIRFADGPAVRAVLVVNPRSGQPTSVANAGFVRAPGDGWLVEVLSEVALRYVELDVPGWTVSDNYFHLAPGVPYRVTLVRTDGRETPAGTMTSIDLVTGIPIGPAS